MIHIESGSHKPPVDHLIHFINRQVIGKITKFNFNLILFQTIEQYEKSLFIIKHSNNYIGYHDVDNYKKRSCRSLTSLYL